MTTADQNKQELIDWLFAYAKKHQIGYLKPNDALIVFFVRFSIFWKNCTISQP